MTISGLSDMANGSCSAALIGLWFGLPVSALGTALFLPGALMVRGDNPRAMKMGLVGLALSLTALPLWYVIAGVLSSAFGY